MMINITADTVKAIGKMTAAAALGVGGTVAGKVGTDMLTKDVASLIAKREKMKDEK